MIRETIITTKGPDGRAHIAPIGIIQEGEGWVIAPFKPSATLDNLRHNPYAVANYSDDVLVFAGCLTGRRDWPLQPATKVAGFVLAGCLAHAELAVQGVTEDEFRPRFLCRVVHEENHRPFQGFNRAQAAVKRPWYSARLVAPVLRTVRPRTAAVPRATPSALPTRPSSSSS